ncbi:MAG: DoxX family protein [Pirellula sp.]|nr:DoxX family protein [Pirellula sp.]
MRFIQSLISFVGRALLAAIFLASAIAGHIPKFDKYTEMVAAAGVPEARNAHIAAVACMIIGGVSVLLGFWARFGALLLTIFLVGASYYFHAFWKLPAGDEQEAQMIHFLKNVAMMGAMLMIIANGPGAGAIDKRKVTLELK